MYVLPLKLLQDWQPWRHTPITTVFLVQLHQMLPANELIIDLDRVSKSMAYLWRINHNMIKGLTHKVREFLCANELAQQFHTVLMRWGGSDRKNRGRDSSVNRLAVLYTDCPFFPWSLKNFRFGDAPSQVTARTLNPAASMRRTQPQTSEYNWSAVMEVDGNWRT